MQTKLNGVQLRMKRFRGRPLAQSLGEINGAKIAKDTRKRLAKLARISLKSEGKALTPESVKAEVRRRFEMERAHG